MAYVKPPMGSHNVMVCKVSLESCRLLVFEMLGREGFRGAGKGTVTTSAF